MIRFAFSLCLLCLATFATASNALVRPIVRRPVVVRPIFAQRQFVQPIYARQFAVQQQYVQPLQLNVDFGYGAQAITGGYGVQQIQGGYGALGIQGYGALGIQGYSGLGVQQIQRVRFVQPGRAGFGLRIGFGGRH